MENNFDEKNMNNTNEANDSIQGDNIRKDDAADAQTADLSAEAGNNAEAEHVISYREGDAPHGSNGSYHMTGDSVIRDNVGRIHTPHRPDDMTGNGNAYRYSGADGAANMPPYNNPSFDGRGNVSYAPADGPTSGLKKKKKKSGVAGKIVLVAVCILLSLGCGFAGAFFGDAISEKIGLNGSDITNSSDAEDKMEGLENEIADLKDDLKDANDESKPEIEALIAELEEELDLLKNGNQTVVVERPVDRVDTSSDGSALTYADVAETVGDSVVAITTEYKVVSYWQEYVTGGAGSGIVMSADGHIITNYHVVAASSSYNEFADTITVSFKNGKEYDAEVIGGDSERDIAVIKIEPDEDDSLVPAVFADSDKLKVGEEVIAIGNPLGELSGTTTNGIISALAREVEIEGVTMNLLQTNAAINPGNSGGGLFNMNGELIGVVNAKSAGTGIEGLGFAIPSNDALETAKSIVENGGNVSSAANVKVGISVVTITTADLARQYGVNAYGVYVDTVEEGYNDDVLESLDRIIAVDGQEIASGDDVVKIVRAAEAGDKLEFIIYRDGRIKTVEVTVFENPEAK